jgi:PIN domain nuclease of toxin-antitoxin system
MRVLLDTHALLWWFEASEMLSARVMELLSDTQTEVYVSAASAWEISIKERAGRLIVPHDLLEGFDATIRSQSFAELPITSRHAFEAGSFRSQHRDPFDRVLAAQARVERLVLVSCDEKKNEFDVDLLW